MSEQAAAADSLPLADRIANVFDIGADQPDEDEAVATEAAPDGEVEQAAADPAEELDDVEWEGKQYKVPKPIKESLIRQSDYTKKTQELAEYRRSVESREKLQSAQQEFAKQVEPELAQFRDVEAAIKQYQALDWTALNGDDLMRARITLDQLRDRRGELQKGLEAKQGEFVQSRQKMEQERFKQVAESVRRLIPGYNDSTDAELLHYAKSEGIEDAIPEIVGDARFVKMLWKAQQFDKLQSQKGEAAKAAQKAPPMLKPGSSNPMPASVKSKLNYAKALKATASDPQGRKQVLETRIAQIFGG